MRLTNWLIGAPRRRIFLGFIAFSGLALQSIAPIAAAVIDDDPIGFIADVVKWEVIGQIPSDDGVYPVNRLRVTLRGQARDIGRIEFDVEVSTVFDDFPKRIFVVIDSEATRRLVYWSDVSEFVCIDAANSGLDIERLDFTRITVPGSDHPCFIL